MAALLAGCAASPTASTASPPTPQPLSVIVFPGGWNWPLWVAEAKGLFAREGLAVKVTPTPNSTFQMKGLIQGEFDLAMTAMDNVIAYREGQGEAGIDGPDLVVVMGGDNGFLRLVAAPEIRSPADLRGKTLSVDALTTGYAFVLREMLERNGLVLDRDYKTERAGGGMQRFNALMERKHAGTMLISPLDIAAQAQGFRVLANATQALGSYQGYVAAVRQGWARSNAPRLQGYIRAYADAVEWIHDPANKAEAIRIYLANMPPNTSQQSAETAYRVLLTDGDGFQRRARLDIRGAETVVKLRQKFASPGVTLKPAAAYYDGSFYEAALRTRR
ncbi:ABC transporter substrate-binding protein [Ramlibacter sp. AW1]|uniref:ABC transporter substrate-binding protein n=1 Tax=Ramlibacter aurantiacus TaxID=2801330 RepID=A0A936ZQD4_9BURK|nr:ABC transporter substrate-binding protein [Ramlibacter aurantiacus]MBL0421548.1 ABC transporter substrate-binding protein [Ramlibacter aurantiacus]